MQPKDARSLGWQGVCLVALTYVYFLIFAQFAFLHRLADLGIAGSRLKIVMAAMATGGILFSFLTPRLSLCPSPNLRLRIGLGTCGAAALLALLPLGLAAALAVSFLIGVGLALLTVTLATNLRQWMGDRNPLLLVGLGTGIGYLICNFPPLFTASPQLQASTACIFCLAGICLPLGNAHASQAETENRTQPGLSFPFALACFTALVWLDSAAFFIIQNAPALKAATWEGSIHLWSNGALHLAAALASAWFLGRRGLPLVLAAAFLALGYACLLLLDPEHALLASVFYPISVSLYSVALVAYPSLLSPAASAAERGRQAGWIYAVAGWFGSAMGIGMGQNLGQVPSIFVFGAGAVVLSPLLLNILRQRSRELALTGLVLLAAFGLDRFVHRDNITPQLTQVERGRQVYISEGCMNCHSQYVRPNSPDVLMWGPAESTQELRLERPPLIGNRRQGPDLAEVGGRRSPLWLKAHFYDPQEVSGASIMPSFAYLFRDERGDDLVAYLESLRGAGTEQHIAAERSWHPTTAAMAEANADEGKRLFQRDCATCHAPSGRTLKAWQASFKRLPTDLAVVPLRDPPISDRTADQLIRLAQITKFGIPGTDMAGHEYLSDTQIASIGLWLQQNIAQPIQNK